MKTRIVALCCVIAVASAFCACTASTGETTSSEKPASSAPAIQLVDVAEYAQKGEIYGCEFALGASPDEIKTKYNYQDPTASVEETAESQAETESTEETTPPDTATSELLIVDGETVKMATGSAKYYYRASLADSGIGYIAFFDDPFSYYVGITSKNDILRTVSAEPIYNNVATADDLFFYFGVPENVQVVRYQFGDYTLSFFFENDCLSATSIYAASLWDVAAAENGD